MAESQETASLQRRLERIEHHQAILELKHRYLRACDTKDVAGFRACFVDEGADIVYGPMGRLDDADALADLYERVALRRDDGGYLILDMHHAVHPTIAFESPDAATGTWMLRFRQIDRGQGTERTGAVEYADRYVRRDGVWLIQRSHARELWAITRPLPEDHEIHQHIDG